MAGGAVQHSICGGLVAVAMLVPACASATILTRCGSLADLQPLADASTLPAEEQAALATVRSAAEVDNHEAGRSDAAPPTVHNFNSLLIAINPGLAKGAEFGTRSLIVATRINGVTYSFLHPVRSPRYRFWSTISSSMVTSLTFFGSTHVEIRLSGPARRGCRSCVGGGAGGAGRPRGGIVRPLSTAPANRTTSLTDVPIPCCGITVRLHRVWGTLSTTAARGKTAADAVSS
jgi:hypothetical protein